MKQFLAVSKTTASQMHQGFTLCMVDLEVDLEAAIQFFFHPTSLSCRVLDSSWVSFPPIPSLTLSIYTSSFYNESNKIKMIKGQVEKVEKILENLILVEMGHNPSSYHLAHEVGS